MEPISVSPATQKQIVWECWLKKNICIVGHML